MEYYLAIKRSKVPIEATTRVNLKNIKPEEARQKIYVL